MKKQQGRAGHRMGSWSMVGMLALLTAASACERGEVCQELGRCGGDPIGTWVKKPGPSYCQEQQFPPPPDPYLVDQPVPLARMPLPEATNLDWCSGLVLTADPEKGVKVAEYYARDLPLSEARAVYKEDGKFDIGFARRARFPLYYSRTCLTQFGRSLDCSELTQQLTAHNQGNPAVSMFECSEEKIKGGCNCSFQYEEISVLAGSYSNQDNVITHFTQSPTLRYNRLGYCVQGETLQLSGVDNNFILNRLGLRTMEMVKVKCDDGEQGPGEAGVDCGELCPNACMN